MIDTGQIRDGLTILSLLQAWRCLHDKKVATNSTQM
jgi:hypothetical protein